MSFNVHTRTFPVSCVATTLWPTGICPAGRGLKRLQGVSCLHGFIDEFVNFLSGTHSASNVSHPPHCHHTPVAHWSDGIPYPALFGCGAGDCRTLPCCWEPPSFVLTSTSVLENLEFPGSILWLLDQHSIVMHEILACMFEAGDASQSLLVAMADCGTRQLPLL
jgi:hypothetical protein